MSTYSTNSSTFGRAMCPSQDERLPSLTNSGRTTDGNTTDHEIEYDEELKNGMKLLWAERENIDLKLKLYKVEVENRGLKAKVTELEADMTTIANTSELRKEHSDLLSLDSAEEAKQEASRMCIQIQSLQDTKDTLANHLDKLRLKLDEAKFSRTNDAKQAQSRFLELQTAITALEAKNKQMADRNDQLTAHHFASLEAVKNNAADLAFYRSKNENNEHELKTLRAKVTTTEAERDWHRSEHTKILEVRNALNAERGHDSPLVDRLKGDIAKLRDEKKDLENQRRNLKASIAYNITELDLADANLRVFTCKHENTVHLPDGQNTTREKTAYLIATAFRDWENDDEFMEM